MTEPTMQTTVVDGVTKYTMAFPLTDADGKPLLDRAGNPRFTNVVADTPEEVAVKIANANLESARALDRAQRHIEILKNKKPTPVKQAPDLKGKPLTDDERVQVGLELQDPRKAAAAIEKVVESRVAPVVTAVHDQGQTLDIEARKRVAREFFNRHPDYRLAANGQMLAQWLSTNGYEFTLDNIEIAFANLQDQLARKAPPAPPNATPAVPDNAPPENAPPNSGTPPTPQRRAPVGGISNSQVSGTPVSRQTFPYTRDQLLTMAMKHDPRYTELIQNPATNAMVNTVLSGR